MYLIFHLGDIRSADLSPRHIEDAYRSLRIGDYDTSMIRLITLRAREAGERLTGPGTGHSISVVSGCAARTGPEAPAMKEALTAITSSLGALRPILP